MAPKPKSLINKERRDRYRAAGLVNPETWVPRESVDLLAKYVAKLNKKYGKTKATESLPVEEIKRGKK